MRAQILSVIWKDLRLEWRQRTRLSAMVFFALMTLLLFSFAAGADSEQLRDHAAAYLWLAILLASTLSLAESFRLEVEDGNLEALLLLPIAPGALYYGKAIANAVLLVLLGLFLLPVSAVLFDTGLGSDPLSVLAFLLLGAAGISAPGTLYAALSCRISARDVMLPLLLFSVTVPVLLSVVQGTALAMEGDPLEQAGAWMGLLVVFDLIYWALGGMLFSFVVEE